MPKLDEVTLENDSTRDLESTMLAVWCFGLSEDGVMKEKFFLAIVITFSLSCVQNWTTPTAKRMGDSTPAESHHLASLWSEPSSQSVFLLQDFSR
ncbi:MAG: hypothetical protein C4287_19400 [Leptolyngbya sp. ERB_1_2]